MSAPHSAMLLYGAAAAPGVTWNPSDKGSDVALSSGNLVAATSGGGTSANVRGTTSHSTTGKFYFEVVMTTVVGANNMPRVGVCDSSVAFTNAMGYASPGNFWTIQSTPGFTYRNTGAYKSSGVTYANGDVVMVAVDFATGRIWFGKNGTWILSGNPGSNTNPTWTTIAGTLFPCVRVSNSSQCTARFASGSWGYSAPSGFGAW